MLRNLRPSRPSVSLCLYEWPLLTESCAVFDVRPRKTPSTAEPPRTQVREPSRGGGGGPSHLVERERESPSVSPRREREREGERTEKERERENMKLT